MSRQATADKTFVHLVDTYLDRVYRYLCNLTRDDDVARDLSHEAFLKLRKQVDKGTEISEAYVFTTARNTALSSWRKNKREEDKRETWDLVLGEHCGLDGVSDLGCADDYELTLYSVAQVPAGGNLDNR